MLFSILMLIVIAVLTFSYVVGTYNENYWKKRGVKYHGGKNIFSTIWEFTFSNKGLFEIFGDIYKQYPEDPAVATSSIFRPALFVKDPENIQSVLSTNFKAFYHRGVDVNENDKLTDHVLFMNGNRWKLTRQKMSPLFTSSKLKNMHYILEKCAQDFIAYLNTHINDKDASAFEMLSLYCCAAITASVFGVRYGESSLESPFLKMGQAATRPTFKSNMKFVLNSLSPTMFKLLNLKFAGEFEEEFIGAMKQVLREREKETVKKHDFADLAMSIQKNGTMRDVTTGYEIEPTDELMAAQGFFFLIAGVDPTAFSIFATLFEVAKRPDIQERLQRDIDEAYENNNGNVNYDVIMKMEYLDKVLEEGLRMHPPVGLLNRRCMEDSVLPVGNIQVEKGTTINIPILAIHYDEKYYPNPEVFDPERFSPEQKRQRPHMTFMPFGEGNRLCIGQRLAYLQAKTGIVYILRNFNLEIDDKTQTLKYMKSPILIRPVKEANFRFVARNKK